MSTSTADMLRSLLIGQSVWLCLWMMVIAWMFIRTRPRPGATVAVAALLAGTYAMIIDMSAGGVERLGSPPTYHVWLALAAILTISFGCCFASLHLLCNDEFVIEKIKKWFVRK